MAKGNTIATAYVQIIPSMEGVKGNLEREFGVEGQNSGSAFSKNLLTSITTINPMMNAIANKAIDAVGSVAQATADLGKQAIEAYSDFEQLQGGVETLFGADAHKVMTNANMAFKTAGQSANQYMEMTIQSAASMISSLEGDTSKAAELMDLAIVDMSDNVNKMGTSMEAVQYAYRGFSRGNFTMLDNLALGFAGTKEGMKELLEQAKEISGIEYNIDSYSDIVQAIHVIQEEMGIAGTTQREAAETIQGSLASMKSAWDNLITSIANNDMDTKTFAKNFVDSLLTVFDNVIPAAQKAMDGIIVVIDSLLPALTDRILPRIIQELPGFVQTFVETIGHVFEASPELMAAGIQIVVAITQGITAALPQLMESVPTIIEELSNVYFENAPLLTETFYELIVVASEGFIQAMPLLIALAPEMITQFINMLLTAGIPLFFDTAGRLIVAMIEGLIQSIPSLIEAGLQLIFGVITGIDNGIPEVLATMFKFRDVIDGAIKKVINEAVTWGVDLVMNFAKGITSKFPAVSNAVEGMANLVRKYLHFSEPDIGPLADFGTYAPDMMKLFAQGIAENEDVVTAQIQSSFDFGEQIKAQNDIVVDTAMNSPAYAPTASVIPVETQNNDVLSGQFAQAVELLGQLVNKEPVEIGADADGIFSLVRRKNEIYARANGRGAFA